MSSMQAMTIDTSATIEDIPLLVELARRAQREWAKVPVRRRLRILRSLRHRMAASPESLAASVPNQVPGRLHRSAADTLVSEVLPVVESCLFLEREASWILSPRQQDGSSAFWLGKVSVEVRRAPLGVVLIVAPGNYPLFLPGVQALQALAAGNAVLWKPAPGGTRAAHALRHMLVESGLNPDLLQILSDSAASAVEAIQAGVDKTFLTGSSETGRSLLHRLADTLTPSVMELSGCDAVFVFDGADIARVVDALTFGMRLNGSATCMAPRRIFATVSVAQELLSSLATTLKQLPAVPATPATHALLDELLDEGQALGAKILLDGRGYGTPNQPSVRATLVSRAKPEMRIAATDIFAPVLSVIEVDSELEALEAYRVCPFALTAAIFASPRVARRLAGQIDAGTILINDLIVSAADPRAAFGGHQSSGFGVTRGREGLLEMTTVKTVLTQRSRSRRAYQPTTQKHSAFFAAYLRAFHCATWRERMGGIRELISAAIKLK